MMMWMEFSACVNFVSFESFNQASLTMNLNLVGVFPF